MPDREAMSTRHHGRLPLETDRIPVLPPGAPYLLQALNDDDLDFVAIARAIERVPTVAARLLALANSAWSSPRSPVTSIEATCSRLGLQVVRSASIALAIAQPFNPAECPPFRSETFWGSALLNAEAASLLADRLLAGQVSTARTAALIATLGLVWLADALPAQTAAALAAAADDAPGGVNRRLREHCGIGYDESGALLARAWGLPGELQDAIAGQCHGDTAAAPLATVVATAIAMAAAARHRIDPGSPPPAALGMGLTDTMYRDVFERVRQACHATQDLAEALFPLR